VTENQWSTLVGYLVTLALSFVFGALFGKHRRIRKVQITLDVEKSDPPPAREQPSDGK